MGDNGIDQEQRRLDALSRFRVLDTPAESVFDDLAALAAQITGTPTALISLIDQDRQWFKSVVNFPMTESSREVSFCAHAIRQDEVLVVEDATEDDRFADNPLVVGAPHIRFYAGAPMITSDGFALGTVCGVGYEPRSLAPEQQEALARLARQAVRELELRRSLAELSEKVTGQPLPDEAHMLNAIIDRAPAIVHVKDAHGRYQLVNEHFLQRFGRTRAEVLGRTDADLFDADTAEQFRSNDRLAMDAEEPLTAEETLVEDGVTRVYTSLKFALTDWQGRPYATCGIAMDVTDRVRAEEESRRTSEYLRQILAGSLDGIVASSADGTVVEFNPAAEQMYGYTREEAVGQDVTQLLIPPAFHHLQRASFEDHLAGRPSAVIGHRVEVLGHRKGGEVFPLELAMVDLGQDPGRFVGFARDISDRRHAEERLRVLAEQDPHTGLPNRGTFLQLLATAAVQTAAPAQGSVLLMDLDAFKHVNDTLGHRAGDECLRHVAEVLGDRVREGDVVARLGGDEFAVLLPTTPPESARRVAESLVEVLRARPAVVEGRPVRLTASVGVGPVVLGGTPEEMLHLADAAMYQAKQAGRDRVAVYSDVQSGAQQVSHYAGQAQLLRDALADGRFTLFAQPVVDIRTGATSRHELLVRMLDASGALVPPAAFLPAAERFDLIQRIDRWVVTEAVRLLTAAGAAGLPVPHVHVNLSGRSLSDAALLTTIEQQVATVDPCHVVFEITETAAVTHLDTAIAFTQRLAEMGCGLALDDFGAGYASFYYLKHLPVQQLKIDGDFVRGMLTDRLDRAVVRAAVSVAGDMGYSTVAEFVETAEVLDELRDLGVDFVQGYHTGRPEPAAEAFGLPVVVG